MTLNELQKWMLSNDVSDSWWVAIDGEVLDNLMGLPDVGKIKDQHPVALVAVLHESKAEEDDPEWIPFQKDEGARFKVVSSRFDGLQVRVPSGAEKAASEMPAKEETKSEAAPKPVAEAPAQVVATALPADVEEKIANMQAEINALREEVMDLRELADELKKPILEAQKILEEREQFLEMSETSLFDKAQKQEVLQTELEQLREELHTRESHLKEREAALG